MYTNSLGVSPKLAHCISSVLFLPADTLFLHGASATPDMYAKCMVFFFLLISKMFKYFTARQILKFIVFYVSTIRAGTRARNWK